MANEETKQTEGGGPATMKEPGSQPRLQRRFREEIGPKVAERFGRANPMSRPTLERIVVNVNMGRHIEGAKIPQNVRDTVVDTLTQITGQRPVVLKAKKSVSNFKVREGMETSAIVTLRRERMWHFLDRLINLATPRIKDFRGLSTKSFDSAGNYSIGLQEQAVFPEIDMGRVSFSHGMNINLVFNNSNPEISRFVLEELGVPFRKEGS